MAKTLGGTADDIPYRVIQTSDGGYAIAGWTESSNGDVTGYQGNKDCWVVKLNSTGGIVWQKSLGGTSEEEFRYIIETADGGLACVGWSLSNDGDVSGLHGFRDTWLVKLSSGGVIQWQKMLGGLNDERGYTVVQTTDLGYMVSSVSSSTSGDVTANNGLLDYWIAKTDNLGNIQWQKNYGGSGIESNRGTIQTSDGGYLINGYTESSNIDITNFQGVQDVWLVKTDNLGVIQWQKTFGGNATDRSGFVTQTADGGYLFSGNTNSTTGDVSFFQGGASDYWLVKISSTGTIEWEKTMGGTGGDFGGSVVLLNNGYLMMGSTDSNNGDVTGNKGSSDLWMVKLLNSCAPGSVTATLSGDASICSGGSTNLTINFTGAAPWFYTVDGGPSQTTFTSPVTIPVSPVTNTTYNVTSVSDNVCPTELLQGRQQFW
ncbi:MAG: hypothetical protein IPP71_11320 [Bacteroidetes bacterium]|nr:hypothetical protein [Bacteroidota bacterium]